MLLSDEQAFKDIMHTYSDDLLRLAYLYVKDWQVAEDIVLDTFLSYYEKFEQFEQRATLKTYLVRITINFKKLEVSKSLTYESLFLR